VKLSPHIATRAVRLEVVSSANAIERITLAMVDRPGTDVAGVLLHIEKSAPTDVLRV